MKNLVNNNLLFSILIFVFTLSCTSKKNSNISIPNFDSLLVESEDSLGYNYQHSFELLKKAEKMAKDSTQLYMLKVNLSQYYFVIQKPDSALSLAKEVMLFAQNNIKNERSTEFLTSAYNSIGLYYSHINNLDSALYNFIKCYKVAIEIKNYSKLPDICINIADMYTRKGDFVNGIGFYRKALSVSDSLHLNNAIKFPIYFGLGQAYFMGLRNFELSDEFFKKAEQIYDNRSLSEKFTFCNNRGNYYYYKEDYVNALPWFIKAKKIVEPLNSDFYINFCNANLGDVYFHLNKTDSAQNCIDKSYNYFVNTDNKTLLFYIATVQAELALKKGKVGLAKRILSKYSGTEGVEPEILGIRYKTLQKFYLSTSDYQNAFKIQSLAVKLNDSIRSERVKSNIAELDARYQQDTTLMNKELLIHTKDVQLGSLRVTVLIWALVAIAAIFMALSSILFFKRLKEKEQTKHLEVISKYRLQNLRSRISPHFLFNALNRQIISEQDNKKNKEMLELVKMLRQSLEMTDQLTVNLDDELEFVKSYLTIESSSFDQDFHLIWEIDENIEFNRWKVPAMLLQIPVENALKHALRPKIGEKELFISIQQFNSALQISIIDNGKGYFPESNNDSNGTKSGLKVIFGIIQLLNQNNKNKLKFSISNLEHENKTGTKVMISIPLDFNYLI